ncbi:hypothetical protein YC2023_089206 [Brassica napus]
MSGTQLLDELAQAVRSLVQLYQLNYVWLDPRKGQHTQDVCGCPCVCPWVSISTHMTSVAVCVCPSAHTGCLWLSISTHISTLVLGLSTLVFPVDCSGDFGPRGLSVQYTQDVRGGPSAHTGRPYVSISTHRTSMAVRVCLCVSVSTHRTSVAVQHTHRTSVGVRQHTQDVRGCPYVFVCVCVCPCVSVSTHRTSMAVHQYTYQHAVLTGHPWVSASTDRTSVAVRVCSCVSVSTHRTFVAVHQTSVGVRQHTQDNRGCPCVSVSVCQHTYKHADNTYQHARPSHGLFSYFPWTVLVLPMDCSRTDFGQLMHHVSTHISTLALSKNCSCTDLDMSSSFDGLDCPSQSY